MGRQESNSFGCLDPDYEPTSHHEDTEFCFPLKQKQKANVGGDTNHEVIQDKLCLQNVLSRPLVVL